MSQSRAKIIATLGASMAAAVLAVLVGTGGSGVIPQEEGRRNVAYLDPVGVPTICEGWTQGVKLGDVATNAQCDELTLAGIGQALDIFMRHVPQDVRERMPAATVAAFLSFIYNVGPGAAGVKDGFVWLKSGRHSTMYLRLQEGRIATACQQFPAWTSARGKRLPGLMKRRAREMDLCLQDLGQPLEQIQQAWHGAAPAGPEPEYTPDAGGDMGFVEAAP